MILFLELETKGEKLIVLNKKYSKDELRRGLLVKGSPLSEETVNRLLERGIFLKSKMEQTLSESAKVVCQGGREKLLKKGEQIVISPYCELETLKSQAG